MKDLFFVILMVLSILFGSAYTALGLKARPHLLPSASESNRSIGWLYWWSFSPKLYDEEGKKICQHGQYFGFALIAIFIAWYWWFWAY